MKTTMTCFAKQQIRETTRYICKEFGKKSKDNFGMSGAIRIH